MSKKPAHRGQAELTSAYTRHKNSQQVNNIASNTPPSTTQPNASNTTGGTPTVGIQPEDPASSGGKPQAVHPHGTWTHDPYAPGRPDAGDAHTTRQRQIPTHVQDASPATEVAALEPQDTQYIGYRIDGTYGPCSRHLATTVPTIHSRYPPDVCHADKNAFERIYELLTLQWMSDSAGPRSMLKYASTMAALFPVLKTTTEYTAWSAAVSIEAGRTPVRQVEALARHEHRTFIRKYPDSYWAKWLAWKLNSRWAEIMELTRNDLIGPLRIGNVISYAVNFAEKTKASKKRPYRPDMLVHLRDTPEVMEEFGLWLATLTKYQHFTTLTTAQLRAQLQECFPGRLIGTTSLKAGATTYLTKMAAKGLIPVELVAQMAKHQGKTQKLPDTTVRYGRNKAALAIMMGSGEATMLL